MPAAWQGGQIDAAWVWDPTLSQLLEDGGERSSPAPTPPRPGKPTYDLGPASNAFIEENPEFMTQWAKAQDHAVKMINDDPDGRGRGIAVELGIDPARPRSCSTASPT